MSLQFHKVNAAYRGKIILQDVSFSVAKGSITALAGRNGRGKTTLLRCLTGEKSDYRGKILLDGREVRTFTQAERAVTLSYLPQELPAPQVSVRELVSFGRAPYTPFSGKLSPSDLEKIDWAIRAVGMQSLAEAQVDRLSGGERKKAFFAMTLAQDTPLVVLDEPTAHLDAQSRFAFLDLVERLRQETGKTFLLVMHELPDLLQYAQKLIVVEERTVYFSGTPEQFLAQQLPQKCFGVTVCGDRAHGYAVTPLR